MIGIISILATLKLFRKISMNITGILCEVMEDCSDLNDARRLGSLNGMDETII
jgi:hypothetical protein